MLGGSWPLARQPLCDGWQEPDEPGRCCRETTARFCTPKDKTGLGDPKVLRLRVPTLRWVQSEHRWREA